MCADQEESDPVTEGGALICMRASVNSSSVFRRPRRSMYSSSLIAERAASTSYDRCRPGTANGGAGLSPHARSRPQHPLALPRSPGCSLWRDTTAVRRRRRGTRRPSPAFARSRRSFIRGPSFPGGAVCHGYATRGFFRHAGRRPSCSGSLIARPARRPRPFRPAHRIAVLPPASTRRRARRSSCR